MNLSLFVVTAALLAAPLARADIVVDWNDHANAVMAAESSAVSGNPVAMARTLAMMHVAMFDAIDACHPAYRHYLHELAPSPGASPQAAAHSAAHAVLVALYPHRKSTFDSWYASAMAALGPDAGNAAGIALGEQAAALMVKARQDDGTFGVPDSYRPTTSPGAYVPTVLPVVSNVASRKPFVLQSIDQFRPGPPPALGSAIWASDFNETREWGAANSGRRTPRQTETARFWEQLGTPAWNQIARALAANRAMPLAERARVFAQLNMAMYDAYLAVFESKYHYHFWRPVTAIRNGDQDGNDATVRDATWRPLIDTPPHPEYPCAHCAADGAAGAVLKHVYGDGPVAPFTVTYLGMPKVSRDYTRVQEVQEEVSLARIWGGVHFRNSNRTGDALGEKIGDYVLQRTLMVGAN